ncbi:IQ and ubiquitin-like domain-containing protein [Elysia marginata]|uniref:IQ and ubiquitin-like domain-containing protein n=1 Tax=Elysia marginata TaxID=1093978 RepID=A0AAV4H5Z6_9GAST|nr:IQ and ubiquitin-like domain-containing protein [Elysia marginata]
MADQETEPAAVEEKPSGTQEEAQNAETSEVMEDQTQNNQNGGEDPAAEAAETEGVGEKNDQGADNTAQHGPEETEAADVEEPKTDPAAGNENQNNNVALTEGQAETESEEKPADAGENQDTAEEQAETKADEPEVSIESPGTAAAAEPEAALGEQVEESNDNEAAQEKKEMQETEDQENAEVAQDPVSEDATVTEDDQPAAEAQEAAAESGEKKPADQEQEPKEQEENLEKLQEEETPADSAKPEEPTEQTPDTKQGPGGDEAADEKPERQPELDTNVNAPEQKGTSEGNVKTSEVPATATAFQTLDARQAVNLEATATVKLMLMPSGQVVTIACTLGKTLESLKTHFASELKMSSSLIMMTFDGRGMSDSTTLADLGVGPNGTVQLELQSADPVNNPLKPYRPRQEYHMPDVITVRVITEDCESKDVVVEIERSRTKKPFLGGFRNKNTGVEYHNASAQTLQKPRPLPTAERFCRDTQTCEQKNTRQQTTNTTSTQMTGIGVYISLIEDKLITPGKYFSADDYWALVLSKVIILQKYYRRWLAKRYVKKLREDKAKRLEWERQEELRKKKEKEDRLKREYARRINPKTKADFDMLLHCLEKWRQEEMERINTTLEGAERKAALCMLLEQETELLSAIERHKNEANLDNRDKRIMQFLEKAAAPKKWQGHDGKLTFMDTPYTIRAKELRDIYNSINMKYLTQDERLDVLLTLKHTVKEHDCKLTQEIIELIDREADLLMRGVKEGNLTGLRKRISTLFLQYIKTPTFNPEAAKLLKVPQDPSTLRKNINYCHSCGNYLPSTEFFITSNSRTVGRCRNCVKVENDGRQREDHSYYRIILKALRKSEETMQDGSSICYLLQGYGHVFIHKVTQKHNFARNYFSRLPGMAEALRQKVGSRELPSATAGPSVAGHSVPKAAQKV